MRCARESSMFWRDARDFLPKGYFYEKIKPVLFLGLLMGFSFASSLYAHHGYASYDMTQDRNCVGNGDRGLPGQIPTLRSLST